MSAEKIIIIDGSSYFFRAFFAIPPLTKSDGFPTNAIYGFVNMVNRVLEVEKPTKLAIAFDTPKPSFRKKLYKAYKANREAPPDDLVRQIPHIQRVVDCYGIFRIEKAGYEADDVIGTVVQRARTSGYDVEIISGDKDLMQLVNGSVTLYDTMKERRYDGAAVREKFGVGPEQMVDLLALMGDSSDNVPGVRGVGPKTASELLQRFKSLDGIYDALDDIKQKKRRETLENEKDLAYLSRDLVTLECEVPVEFEWNDFEYKGPNREALQVFFEEMEFQNLLKRFGMVSSQTDFKPGEYLAVVDEFQLERVVSELSEKEWLCLDTETTSLNVHEADLVGVSLSGAMGSAYYIPVGHREGAEGAEWQLPADVVRKHLKPLLENPKVKKVGQHLKYDLQILKHWGVELAGVSADTLIASYLLDAEQSHNLDALAYRLLGHQNITYEEVAGKGKKQLNFAEVAVPVATPYAAEDAEVTLKLHQVFLPKIKEAGLEKLYNEMEVPLIGVLAEMESVGVSVDEKKLRAMGKELDAEILKVQETVYKLAGEEFNLNSPKQLANILFEKLKLPTRRKTKTGFSTDERVLMDLASEHKIAEWLLKNRELVKLKTTYIDGLLSSISSRTGRIHTSFNQTVAATGRLSSSNPNLQNIPVSRDGRYDIRSLFMAQKGWELLSADYSQVELRVLAHMSEDPELLKAFERDEDVHAHTGKLIFGVSEISKEQRAVAKTINFGVVYGQTPYGLSRQLKISTTEAKRFIDSYFERYAGVKSFLEGLIQKAKETGMTQTLMGRRRFVRELDSKNRIRREMAERVAINTPLQGTAADMIKMAMLGVHRKLKDKKLKAHMTLQVHDELVVEAPESEKKTVEGIVRTEMESALKLKVPLKVDCAWSKNWGK